MAYEMFQIQQVIGPDKYRSSIPYHKFRADAVQVCSEIVGTRSILISPQLHEGEHTNKEDGRFLKETIYLTPDNIVAIVRFSRVLRGEGWEMDTANVDLHSNNTSVPLTPLKDRLERAVTRLYEERFKDK